MGKNKNKKKGVDTLRDVRIVGAVCVGEESFGFTINDIRSLDMGYELRDLVRRLRRRKSAAKVAQTRGAAARCGVATGGRS